MLVRINNSDGMIVSLNPLVLKGLCGHTTGLVHDDLTYINKDGIPDETVTIAHHKCKARFWLFPRPECFMCMVTTAERMYDLQQSLRS